MNKEQEAKCMKAFERIFTKYFPKKSVHRAACEAIWQAALKTRPTPPANEAVEKIREKLEDICYFAYNSQPDSDMGVAKKMWDMISSLLKSLPPHPQRNERIVMTDLIAQADALIQRLAEFHVETAPNGVETICINNSRQIAEELHALYCTAATVRAALSADNGKPVVKPSSSRWRGGDGICD